MNEEETIGRILHLAEQTTDKPLNELTVGELQDCYYALQEIRDAIAEHMHNEEPQTLRDCFVEMGTTPKSMAEALAKLTIRKEL